MTTLKDLFHETLKQLGNDPHGITDDPANRNYLCDLISEAAEMDVDIYDSCLYAYLAEHAEEAEDVLDEFGFEGCGSSLLGIARMTEYVVNERELYESLDQMIKVLLLRGMFCYGISPDEDARPYLGMIDDYAANAETCDRIVDIVDEFLLRLEESKAM